MRLGVLAVGVTALLAGCADSPASPSVADDARAVAQVVDGITASEFTRMLGVIAADSMRGRGTPSREVELTALYVAAAFQSAGLTPAGDNGTFVQRFTLSALASNPTATAPNVVAALEGSDPARRGEYVYVTAHLDHVGVTGGGQNCAANGADSICNGANDNGSGTVAVMQLARAFGALPTRPARTLVFAAFSGEERGLWGSAYLAAHPPKPLAQTVAVVNIDMIGRNASDSVVIVGKTYSSIGAVTDQVTKAHPELGMRLVNDPWNGTYFTRSDQYSFAKLGVPSVFFFNGPHTDVHTARDDVPLVNGDIAARSIKMVFHTVRELANASSRPVWDAASKARWAPGIP